jgi:U4/U6 small nuclear ribonucleoprotein PRP31
MATIADELLNDFGDSGDENEEEQIDSTYLDNYADQNGDAKEKAGEAQNGDMDLDDDEEEPDEDVEGHTNLKAEPEEDAEETKARVEKMELHNVSDVRSVAGLMKQLEPLLEVSLSTFCPII